MPNRIDKTLAELKSQGKKALLTFVMGGDPDIESTLAFLNAMAASGADIIEVGVPFSDPMADGVVIQDAGLRALKVGTNLKKVLGLVRKFREKNASTPIVLMGYYNPLLHYGVVNFASEAASSGVDGVIIVDLPPEEEAEALDIITDKGIHFIHLATPTTFGDRLKIVAGRSSGFLYLVSVAGVTGTKHADAQDIHKLVTNIKTVTSTPVMVGFGIKTPEQAADMAKYADGVVVGSAIVERIGKYSASVGNMQRIISDVSDFVGSLKKAIS